MTSGPQAIKLGADAAAGSTTPMQSLKQFDMGYRVWAAEQKAKSASQSHKGAGRAGVGCSQRHSGVCQGAQHLRAVVLFALPPPSLPLLITLQRMSLPMKSCPCLTAVMPLFCLAPCLLPLCAYRRVTSPAKVQHDFTYPLLPPHQPGPASFRPLCCFYPCATTRVRLEASFSRHRRESTL